MKVIVAFATRYGATARTAGVIASALDGSADIDCVALDARKVGRKEAERADAFVVGSSIAAGQWKGSAKRLLGRLAGCGKPVAVFVSAAGVLSGKEPGSAPDAPPRGTLAEREADAVTRYVDPVVAKASVRPVSKAAFGGKMAFFGKVVLDNWDEEQVRRWADSLQGIFRNYD